MKRIREKLGAERVVRRLERQDLKDFRGRSPQEMIGEIEPEA